MFWRNYDEKIPDLKAQAIDKKREFSQRLLAWHEANRVSFPWRETTDLYRILVTEVLLRKTTRKQVSALYRAFFDEFPTISSLAKASVRKVERVVRPLGMQHQRATILKKMSLTIQDFGGVVPIAKEKLLALPGVGEYAANAVLCLSGTRDAAMVDTNVIRLIQRVFSVVSAKARPRDDPNLWDFVSSLIPKGKATSLNLSMLDFAAAVCTPRDPKCSVCPLNQICDYYLDQRLTK